MAQDIFLKISGIDGESQDAAHRNEIEVTSWHWCITQPSSMHAGAGGGSGKATVSDLVFVHAMDRASPNLMKYCLTGKAIDTATLVMRKAGGNPLEFTKITMSEVLVTQVAPCAGDHTDQGLETVALSFAKVRQEYIVQNAQGGSGGAITASFDIKANREV